MAFLMIGRGSIVTQIANVNICLSDHAVPRLADRIVERHSASLVFRKVGDSAKCLPFDRPLTHSKNITNDRYSQRCSCDCAKSAGQQLYERAPLCSRLA